MQCKKCENIQKDPNTGMLICLTCGNVVEESQVVNALEFDEDQKQQEHLWISINLHIFTQVEEIL